MTKNGREKKTQAKRLGVDGEQGLLRQGAALAKKVNEMEGKTGWMAFAALIALLFILKGEASLAAATALFAVLTTRAGEERRIANPVTYVM